VLCPYCTEGETRVVDSREHEQTPSVRRRRECMHCEKRFTTYERYESALRVLKRDGRKEEFDRDKLKMGMVRACAKRPISVETIDHITTKLETKLRATSTEVASEMIGKMVMQALKKLDKIAYIRFASVYRDFNDVKSFEKEAQLLTH